jgi:hypothetical protein
VTPTEEENLREIKQYLKAALEILESGRVSMARQALVKLYVGMDDYLPPEPKEVA